MVKKALAAFLCTVTAASALVSCGKHLEVEDEEAATTTTTNDSVSATEPVSAAVDALANGTINIERFADRKVPDIDLENSMVKNFVSPKKGDTVAYLKLKGYDGEIKIKFFPEYAELGVENFVGLAEKNYYDGLIFHRVIRDFMIQGGDPTGTGSGGDSLWGGTFDGGTSEDVIHAAGAVAYANSQGTATNTSQFYIVTGNAYEDSQFDPSYPKELKEVYSTTGGAPWLDGGYTIFGQVYDGLDIVFSVQDIATNAQNDKPLEDVEIEYVKIGKYDGEELKWFIADYK